MKLKRAVPLIFVLLLAAGAAADDEKGEPLRALPGAERAAQITRTQCIVCHGIGHTSRARLTLDEWDENLALMKKRGAQFTPADAAVMLEFLAKHYGPDGPPAAAKELTVAAATGGKADAQALLNQHACLGCHAVDKKIVGPSFQEVAARYKSDAKAVDKLTAKIRAGSSGAWGPVPMPPAALSEADARLVAQWVLAVQ